MFPSICWDFLKVYLYFIKIYEIFGQIMCVDIVFWTVIYIPLIFKISFESSESLETCLQRLLRIFNKNIMREPPFLPPDGWYIFWPYMILKIKMCIHSWEKRHKSVTFSHYTCSVLIRRVDCFPWQRSEIPFFSPYHFSLMTTSCNWKLSAKINCKIITNCK